jgi:hypothetical protein
MWCGSFRAKARVFAAVVEQSQMLSTAEEKDMQALHRTFKQVGHTTGKLRNFAEVPMFVDSKSTRLIQLADSIAYWVFRHYARLDEWAWPQIFPFMARLGNRRTGLHQVLDPLTPARLAAAPPPKYPFPPAMPAVAQAAACGSLQPAAQPAARIAPGALVIQ